MSYREACLVSKAVFGSTDEQMHRSFLHIVNTQVVGQRNETTDSRRIEISQFLHLAVVAYHQTQSSNKQDSSSGTNGKGEELNNGWHDKIANEEEQYTVDDIVEENYYNLPEDAELAEGLENDFENYAPSSIPKKKLVPQESDGTNLADNDGEMWGEGGYYDDGELAENDGTDVAMPEYLDSTGIKNNVWQEDNDDNINVDGDDDLRPTKDNLGEEVDLTQIQIDRENEFLAVLMGSLEELPDEFVESVQEQLLETLRSKLSEAIEAFPEPETLDQFDDLIVSILSSDEFVNNMVQARDHILEIRQGQMSQENEDV